MLVKSVISVPPDTFTASAPSALLSASTWGMHRRVWLAILPAVQNRPKLLILHLGKQKVLYCFCAYGLSDNNDQRVHVRDNPQMMSSPVDLGNQLPPPPTPFPGTNPVNQPATPCWRDHSPYTARVGLTSWKLTTDGVIIDKGPA